MVFEWNGTWEDGKDHTGEVGLENQYWLRVCKNCGYRRGLHSGKTRRLIYPLEKDTICPNFL